ncbi:hypothetical protein, partial [Peterkaempfera sp. SMS 1(5)a]|uniref:hypothetical protein n=1 Tax=Peterkaempfera podocarpi TaxID=3232308 RepID=UPI00366F9B93
MTVAGHQAYLEPDAIAFQRHDTAQRQGTFHIVEIKPQRPRRRTRHHTAPLHPRLPPALRPGLP